MTDLSASVRALVAEHGLDAVAAAVLDASREAGVPYGASTPREADGTLRGHRPCFHCGADAPSGEVWDASDDGVLCTVRCGECGRDYAEFYTVEEVSAG